MNLSNGKALILQISTASSCPALSSLRSYDLFIMIRGLQKNDVLRACANYSTRSIYREMIGLFIGCTKIANFKEPTSEGA